jgi:hypothetical protein
MEFVHKVPLATFKDHTDNVVSAVFSLDGRQVLTVSCFLGTVEAQPLQFCVII